MKRKFNICLFLLIFILSLTACSKSSYLQKDNNSTESKEESSSSKDGKSNSTKGNSSKNSSGKCYVQITGAVNKPGVYELEGDARMFQVILMAGGLREDADEGSLNQAGKVNDGQKIVIMTKEEAALMAENSASDGKVDINTADETMLMTLPGIGESKAQSIIKYRETNGPFGSPEDIKNISGIKDGVYNKISDKIKV